MRCFALLVAVAGATLLSKADKEYPVTKVINLLKDMQSQLQTEQKTDEEVFEKLACWCETNKKEKSSAVDTAQSRISELVSTIEEKTAKSAKLTTEIEAVTEEVSKNEEALNQATAIREKELGEFNAEEKDVMQSIQALGNAVEVLGRQHSAEALLSVQRVLKQHLHHKAIEGKISGVQSRTVTAFLQQAPGMGQSYAPQSGQIFGLLKQMKETFEQNLAQSQSDESGSVNGFNELKTAKTSEIKSGKKQVRNKSVELANTDELNAQAKEDLKDTRGALSADQKFIVEMNLKCQMTDAEFQERQKARGEEISAVSEAIAILSDDDAHDLFSKTLGFVQVKATRSVEKKARSDAAQLLKAAAKKSGSTELLAIASMAQLDAFTKVKAAMDKLIAELQAEQKEEVQLKLFCESEFDENEKMTYTKSEEKKDLEAKIESLTKLVEKLTGEIEAAKERIVEAKKEIKFASEDREAENAEYQGVVADQRAAQVIMKKVLNKLASVYKTQKRGNFLLQEGQTPPVQFAPMKQHGGSSVVMGLIEQIIEDSKKTEAEAVKAEAEAQTGYETFIKDSNAEVKSLTTMIVTKTKAIEGAKLDMENAESDLEATNAELKSLAEYLADLHDQCDFVVKNFDIRQKARLNEIEAIQEAKAILSGAK